MAKESSGPTARRAEPQKPIHIVLRRDLKIGENDHKAGHEIAVVALAEDVTLALLADAIKNCIAGPAPETVPATDKKK